MEHGEQSSPRSDAINESGTLQMIE